MTVRNIRQTIMGLAVIINDIALMENNARDTPLTSFGEEGGLQNRKMKVLLLAKLPIVLVSKKS